jgi:hypothetical protein
MDLDCNKDRTLGLAGQWQHVGQILASALPTQQGPGGPIDARYDIHV